MAAKRMTPHTAKIVRLCLTLSALILIIVGLVLYMIDFSPIVAGAVIFAGVMDLIIASFVLPKIFANQMKKEEERLGPL
ncbi:MAG TPA: hypothetical protein PK402_08970 [Tepidisphaeraceae bacterium]|nr:hypothetical protein [Tepidisphaeraceae bacterium]